MAEWQTHQTQNLTLATVCGFKSHLLHEKIEIDDLSSISIFYVEESLEPRVQGLLDINVSSVGSTGKRFTEPFS